MGRYLKKRKRGWYLALPVPKHLRHHFGGKSLLEPSLGTRDETLAAAKAQRLAGEYKLRFLALQGNPYAETTSARDEYDRAVLQVSRGDIVAYADGELDPVEFGVELAIDAIVDRAPVRADFDGEPETILTVTEEARVAGLSDGLAQLRNEEPRHRKRYEPQFRALADRWLDSWKAAPARRASNTGSQYGAAIRLFDEYWGDRPLREVRQRDAAEFVELLKRLPSNHGRGKLAGLALKEAVNLFGEDGKGLAPPTIKRHLLVLKQVWGWAKQLGYCEGEDPFTVKLPKHRKRPSLGWETQDLQRLFAKPPLRRDIYETFYIAMYTGLRASEIADLTWGQIRSEQGVDYLLIEDTKTEAGHRKVPLHAKLSWLKDKAPGGHTAPVFPTFNPEGPRKSRGGDASKLFGCWKRELRVAPRRYVFHSARKNVTRVMEENSVPSNVWARIIGHEPGFTYATYNPTGLTLAKARETIELIGYPEVNMRDPKEIYGNASKLSKSAD